MVKKILKIFFWLELQRFVLFYTRVFSAFVAPKCATSVGKRFASGTNIVTAITIKGGITIAGLFALITGYDSLPSMFSSLSKIASKRKLGKI
jgi:hypothetical protein